MEIKSLNLEPAIKVLTFGFNFVSEVYLIDLVLLSPEKIFWIEICIISQSATIPLLNLTF